MKVILRDTVYTRHSFGISPSELKLARNMGETAILGG